MRIGRLKSVASSVGAETRQERCSLDIDIDEDWLPGTFDFRNDTFQIEGLEVDRSPSAAANLEAEKSRAFARTILKIF